MTFATLPIMMLTGVLCLAFLSPFAAGNTSPGAMCSPWKVPVEVDSPDHRFQPYYVEMHRCHGGCRKSPNSCECIAASEQSVRVSVYDVAVGPTHKVVQNHTSCQCRCKASLRETCKKGGHTWNENTCTCSCPAPPSGTSCKPSQSWDPRRCQCVCSKQSPTCSRGMLWNKSICECTCSIETFARCSRTGKATNMKTCQCQTQPAVTNQLGSRKLEENQMKLVVALVVIGLSLGILIIIDLILMCSKKGFIYGLIKKCNENDSHEFGKEEGDSGSIIIDCDSSQEAQKSNGNCNHNSEALLRDPVTCV